MSDKPCTCHPDDNPPVPCPQKFALSECKVAAPAPDADRIMALHSAACNAPNTSEAEAALRAAVEQVIAENLQRGNVIGRISAHLLGNKNNVTDEDVVIAAAEVGRELQGAIERIKRSDKACPVAWMVYTKDGKSVFVTDNPTDIPAECAALPLFTSPPAAPAPETVAWMIVEPGCEYGPTFGTENAAWSALTKSPPGSELVELIRRKA